MAIKAYLKNVAGAVLAPVAKSIWGVNPNLSMGLSLLADRTFNWGVSGREAYGNKIFYTGANIIVRKMIEAPITFNRKKGGKSTSKYYSKTLSTPERRTIKAQSLDEIEDHELSGMFSIETMEDFWHNYNFGSGVLWFEQFEETLSRNRTPYAVHSLNPSRLEIIRSNMRIDLVYGYRYTFYNGENIFLPKESVMMLSHWNPFLDRQLKGLGVDVVCAKDIALNDAGNEAEGAAMINGGRGTLFSSKIEFVGDGSVVKSKWTKEQMENMQRTVREDMSGARNNRKMNFTNGEVVVTPYGDTLAEMEITKSEDSRWKNIFAIMGIPKELSPAQFSSSENSVDAGYKALVTNLVISELRKFDQKVTKIIQQWWSDIIVVSDITEYSELAPDLKLNMEVYGKPSLSEDERRKVFGYDELPNGMGRAILVPSGLMQLSDLLEQDFDTNDGATEL